MQNKTVFLTFTAILTSNGSNTYGIAYCLLFIGYKYLSVFCLSVTVVLCCRLAK